MNNFAEFMQAAALPIGWAASDIFADVTRVGGLARRSE